MSDEKTKNSSEHSQQQMLPETPTNLDFWPLDLQIGPDIDPKEEENNRGLWTFVQDENGEYQVLPAPEALISGVVDSGTGHRNDPASEDTGSTREGEMESVVTSNVVRGHEKGTPEGASIPFDGFGPLKAVLGAIFSVYTYYRGTVAVRNKAEDLPARITALEVLFSTPPDDVAEQGRRDGLICKLEVIEGRLRSVFGRRGLQRLAGHVQDDEGVFSILEDLQGAISGYQIVRRTTIFDRGRKHTNPAETAVLDGFRCARGAEYQHGSLVGCLKGTRRDIQDKIRLWKRDFDKPPIYWLNGPAGTGKSTIAQTIAESIFSDGQLGASFFCSRDFEDRRNLKFIFPTLAVQLARRHAEFRSIFVPLVQSNPGVVHESLYDQMDKLIVQPLMKSGISTVIVIDALDECKDEESTSTLLSVLAQFASKLPKVKFFVTSRPEPRIRGGFRPPLLAKATGVFVLHEIEPSQVNSDIRLFFSHKFSELRGGNRRVLDDWPTKKQLDLLCERAAGLFVYAAATARFVENRPKKRLNLLLHPPKSNAHEEGTKFNANTALDSLYISILQEAFGDDDPEDDPKIRSVLGAATLVTNPLSPSTIAEFLGFDTEDIFPLLSSVQSLFILQEDTDQPIRPFHKSFSDFITDPIRCTNQRFHVSPPDHHTELLIGCLELMNQKLKKNMCELPDAAANSELEDLGERTEQYIDHSLRYACRSWHNHLVDARLISVRIPEITSILHRFLESKFLFWLEVLSVLGVAVEAVYALEAASKWLKTSPTLYLVNDCLRFVTGFSEVINISASHSYHSALPLSPKTSIVRELYKSHARPLTRIVQGLPISWDPIIVAKKPSSSVWTAAWSPCSRFIAIAWDGFGKMDILNTTTLERVTILHFPPGRTKWLTFSPDARLLTWFGDSPMELISWDLQIGVPISTISPEQQESTLECLSLAYSACGTMLVALFSNAGASTIHTYNVLSGTHISSHPVKPGLCKIWTQGKHIRFTTLRARSVAIWEVGFSSKHPATKVKFLSIPNNFDPSKEFVFLPTPSRLAFVSEKNVFVWDAQHSKLLLNSQDIKEPKKMAFSLDGRFFACASEGPEIFLWKEHPTGYVLHQKFVSYSRETLMPCEPLLSPNGQSIIVSGGSALQLWRTTDTTTSPSSVPTQVFQPTEPFILGFSPDESLAAAARLGSNTATVFDLESGIPRLVIDTGTGIYGLRVAESSIVIVGDGGIATWDLSTGDRVLGARTNVNDTAWATAFSRSSGLGVPSAVVSPGFNHVAIMGKTESTSDPYVLNLYDVSTGKYLAGTNLRGYRPWFTPDGREVWFTADDGTVQGLSIVEDHESNAIRLERLEPSARPSEGAPWNSSRGYEITKDGWILCSGGKRLLWLPPHWQSSEVHRSWCGRFLALLHSELSEVVVLELLE